MDVKESAVAKSRGRQDKRDRTAADDALYGVLSRAKKISKLEAGYRVATTEQSDSCSKCKFNLGDERQCHIVEGKIDNERGISNYYSPKGNGLLPGDLVWEYVKSVCKQLTLEQAHVIDEGAEGFRCRDCKFFSPSNSCLLVKGKLNAKMSCGFIVKKGHGTNI